LKYLLKFSLKDLISKTQIKQEKISKLYQLALELCPIYAIFQGASIHIPDPASFYALTPS